MRWENYESIHGTWDYHQPLGPNDPNDPNDPDPSTTAPHPPRVHARFGHVVAPGPQLVLHKVPHLETGLEGTHWVSGWWDPLKYRAWWHFLTQHPKKNNKRSNQIWYCWVFIISRPRSRPQRSHPPSKHPQRASTGTALTLAVGSSMEGENFWCPYPTNESGQVRSAGSKKVYALAAIQGPKECIWSDLRTVHIISYNYIMCICVYVCVYMLCMYVYPPKKPKKKKKTYPIPHLTACWRLLWLHHPSTPLGFIGKRHPYEGIQSSLISQHREKCWD